MATKLVKLSTPKSAFPVSATCQTTTAAISIGFPSASFTLAWPVSWLRIRVEIFRRLVTGLTHWRPCALIVPVYRPSNWTTRASPGAIAVSPPRANPAMVISTTPAGTAAAPPTAVSAMPTAITPRQTQAMGQPGRVVAANSVTSAGTGAAGSAVVTAAGSVMPAPSLASPVTAAGTAAVAPSVPSAVMNDLQQAARNGFRSELYCDITFHCSRQGSHAGTGMEAQRP